jgi:UDP-N-acetylglucosamine diphosphorylase/glucosamine-1-phosphate N-acetyltransferase
MRVILFEDEWVARLYPITIGRPAFTISCGSYRLADLAGRLGTPGRAIVRPHLHELLRADFPEMAGPPAGDDEAALLVNARLVPAASAVEHLAHFAAQGRPALVRQGHSAAAALLPAGTRLPGGQTAGKELAEWLAGLKLPRAELDLPLLDYPHDVVRWHLASLGENLQDRLARGEYREIADGVFAAPGASLGQYVVTEIGQGPIVLEAGARIGPYCYLSGPVHLGAGTRVLEHAAIKEAVALGHTTKVGGEVEASSIEPYTNKQHHGFLGHSYLGSWVNLGAGTCNSDLKNTYGLVSMEYLGHKVSTGMQFIGAVVGDYAKTAINTSIFTGKTIGACSMVYGFVTTNVASFVNYARSFGQVTEARVEVMAATQARMFKRRGVVQRPLDVELLHAMYELTRHERQLANAPLSL